MPNVDHLRRSFRAAVVTLLADLPLDSELPDADSLDAVLLVPDP